MEKKFGNFKLPEGKETTWALLVQIFECLDIKSVFNLIKSCLIKHLNTTYNLGKKIEDYIANILYKLIERYRIGVPRGTPIVCACRYGRMNDVELFMNLHPFHKYITNRDVNGYRDDMTLKDMVSQVGTDSGGTEFTPLMAAAINEYFQVVKYLIEQGEADPNIADSNGWNALHYAAAYNSTSTELIQLLLTHMTLDSINKKNRWGDTPLDWAYSDNRSPLRQEIIALLRLKGGKANCYDENGNHIAGNHIDSEDEEDDDY